MKRETGTIKVGVRAVDVGYFNVKYTLGRKESADNTIATGIFPALAPRLASDVAMSSPGTATSDGCTFTIDGVRYFVGRGAVYNSSGIEPRPISEDYSVSDKHLALLRGALNYMAEDAGATQELVIEQLVLGLPLNTFNKYSPHLEQRALGEHLVGVAARGQAQRRIVVERVKVIVQPQGALINFGVQHRGTLQDGWALVVDPGGGTLDWYLSHGRTPNWQRSGAYPKAMLACANAVADRINPGWRNQFEIIERIDDAIRRRTPVFKVAGKEYPLAEFTQSVDAVLDESVNYMLSVVGATDNLDHVLLTGGGAAVYRDFLITKRPQLEAVLRIDEDPVFSNVRGFQVAGEVFLGSEARRTDGGGHS
jgi:plasmid segregation protein ParM